MPFKSTVPRFIPPFFVYSSQAAIAIELYVEPRTGISPTAAPQPVPAAVPSAAALFNNATLLSPLYIAFKPASYMYNAESAFPAAVLCTATAAEPQVLLEYVVFK